MMRTWTGIIIGWAWLTLRAINTSDVCSYTLKAMSFGRRRTLFPAASWASTSLVSLKRPADALTMFEKVLKHDQPITMTEKTILNVVFAGIYTRTKKI